MTIKIENLQQFDAFLKEVADTVLPEQVGKLQKRITLDLFNRLVLKSPVGNPDLWKDPDSAPPGYVGGRFRANWQVTIGAPASGSTESTAPPALPNLGLIDGKQTVWITNNVPYAERLEMGWSSQAPAGIVNISIAELAAFT
jgi:hypothetical protein